MSTRSPITNRLIDEARHGHGPTEVELERTLDALYARLEFHDQPQPRVAAAAAVAADVVLTSSASKAATALGGKVVLKLILATVALGGSVTTAVLVRPQAGHVDAPRAAATAPRAPPSPPPAPLLELQPEAQPQPEVAPLASAQAPRRSVRASPRRPDEMTLLGRALAQLRDQDAAGALARLDEHAEHYPHGKFATERKGLRVIALCAAGRLAEGRLARSVFLAQSPRAPIAGNVREACREED